MSQRKTQTAQYWQTQFAITNQDIEAIYNQILEQNQPLVLGDLAIYLVKHQCEVEELASHSELQAGKLYQPKESYAEGDTLVFSTYDFAVGTVTSVREGRHPQYDNFSVVDVKFKNISREFITNFQYDHPLNTSEQKLANLQGLMSPEDIYEDYKDPIYNKLKAALDAHDDFVAFHDQYFLFDLLPEFHEGLFNIADAAIDINGEPLSIDALIEQMGLVKAGQEITDIMRFSVSYRLVNDERFDDVGPTEQILWYLGRIAPPEAHHPPRRLQANTIDYNVSSFDHDLLTLLSEIDDETTKPEDIKNLKPKADKVTISLNYPHRRVGTLPLTARTQPLFPISYYNPVLFEFIDGRTGDTFPGWVVAEHKYVFGLDAWYKKNKLPVGAYITIKRTDNPMKLIVDYKATRTHRDWVRMADISGHRLTFQMNPAPLACQYDELMIISESNSSKIDNYWVNAEEKDMSIYNLLCTIFPELSKLNPQSSVHAKTLYSAANVIRRVGPGVVFQELVKNPCFVPMNHGYWTYDPALRE